MSQPRRASAASSGLVGKAHRVSALAKLLRGYEQQQVTWQELQQRFGELVLVYGSVDAASAGPTRSPTAGPRPVEVAVDGTGTVTETVAEIRPIGWDDGDASPPAGWRVAVILWDGEDQEVFYDPRRVASVMTLPKTAVSPERRSQMTASGWRRVGTDREGSELWIRRLRAAAVASLDALRDTAPSTPHRHRGPEPPQVSL